MALTSQTLFNYGLSVTIYNQYIDFRIAPSGPILTATVSLGYYSLQSLGQAVTNALSAQDLTNTYTFTIDRSLLLENRITISTSGSHLELLFGSGPSVSASIANTLGFLIMDYTGATSYQGSNSAGITLLTQYPGYNYMPPDYFQEVQGAKSVSASGIKESIVFQIQQFLEVEFKWEPLSRKAEWLAFFQWAIQQREFEITPEYKVYGTVHRVTLETTTQNSNGLGFKMREMLPQFPNEYQTGALKFRVIPTSSIYITGS
jgi:hypothetical protein